MRQETSDQAIQERNFGFIALATLAAAAALLTAGTATARNEFKNGFEDELGRIVAHTAVGVGVQALSGAAYYGPPPVAYYPPSYSYGYARPYPVRHVVRHKYVHHHGRDCGHRGYGRGKGHNKGHGYARYDDDDDGGWRGRGHRGDRWDDDDD